MAEVINTPTPNSPTGGMSSLKSKAKNPRLLVLAIALLILIGAAGYFGVTKILNDSSKDPYAITFTGTKSAKLAGLAPGKGASFQIPQAYTDTDKREDTRTSQGYAQFVEAEVNGAKTQVLASRLFVTATDTPIPQAAIKVYKSVISDNLTKKDAKSYEVMRKKLDYFVLTGFFSSSRIKVTLGDATPFTSKNITSGAWQLDVTATDKDNKMPTQKGKMIYIIGAGTTYQFLVTAKESIWLNNTSFYNSILDSIKVDV